MKFNPEDGINGGPRCRNCHKGSSSCGACHNTDIITPMPGSAVATTDTAKAAAGFSMLGTPAFGPRSGITDMFAIIMDNFGMMSYPHTDGPYSPWTTYIMSHTAGQAGPGQGNPYPNQVAQTLEVGHNDAGEAGVATQLKSSRTADWTNSWRAADTIPAEGACSDDGLSWPHRTLGWKMLKDDLFGIDVVGRTDGNSTVIAVGQTRSFYAFVNEPVTGLGALANGTKSGTATDGSDVTAGAKDLVAHDLDSVCLDCHNPTVWNATTDHATLGDEITNQYDPTQNDDDPFNPNDDFNDDLLFRGLP